LSPDAAIQSATSCALRDAASFRKAARPRSGLLAVVVAAAGWLGKPVALAG